MAQDERIAHKTTTDGNEKQKSSDEQEANGNDKCGRFLYQIVYDANTKEEESRYLKLEEQLPRGKYIFFADDGKIGLFDSQIEMKENEELQDFDVMDDKKLILRECTELQQWFKEQCGSDTEDPTVTITFMPNAGGVAGFMIGNDTNKQLVFELALMCSTLRATPAPGGAFVLIPSRRFNSWGAGTGFHARTFPMSFASARGILLFMLTVQSDFGGAVPDDFAAIKNGGAGGVKQQCLAMTIDGIAVPFPAF